MLRITVDKKEYDIALIPVDSGITKEPHHICAYVILKGKRIKEYMDLDCCTYKEGYVYGIDTAHFDNMKMTIEEKEIDAIKQIKLLIKSYNNKS